MSVQDYIDHALGALPTWFSNNERALEMVSAFAEIFQDAEDQADFWQSQAFITTAVGGTATEPDWLNQHAIDRNTGRRIDETDPALRDRLRTFPDALTFGVLLSTAQSVVDAEGIVGTVVMLSLRPNRAFFVTLTSQTGTGGTFTGTAPDMLFQPTAGFSKLTPLTDGVASYKLVLASANTPANDGTFDIDGVSGQSLEYQNGAGVAEADAGVSWTIQRFDALGNLLDGFSQSYLSRGYRMGPDTGLLVVMLPFGCTEATRASVAEALRLKKAAATIVVVECRAIP